MAKPKIAIFDFACCEGCQLQIVNLEEEILSLLGGADVVEWREAMSEKSDEYDIAVIEGSITRMEDEEKLKLIRSRAKVLIALGACATIGGINKLKNNFDDLDEVKKCVYGKAASKPHLRTAPTKSVDEVVDVDFYVHGCPIDRKEFTYIVRSLLMAKSPRFPTIPSASSVRPRAMRACGNTTRCVWDRSSGPAAGRGARLTGSGASAAGATPATRTWTPRRTSSTGSA